MQTNDSTTDWRQMSCYEDPRKPHATGYVIFSHEKRRVYSHRHTWEECYGDELTSTDIIAHHCDNRICRQPLHLFKTDYAGNNHDMYAKGRGAGQFQRKTHCIRGHSMEGAMVGRSKGSTYQRCRECHREWKAAARGRATTTKTATQR